MIYLDNFKEHCNDCPSFVKLWDEYCTSDEIDPEELKSILVLAKKSPFVDLFGTYVEKIVSRWEELDESKEKDDIFRLIVDIQSTNREDFRSYVLDYLQKKYGQDREVNERIRLIGLRGKGGFRGSISHFELLMHMQPGNFVFHKGGWGIGKILEVSAVREQISIEFENVAGIKELSFVSAFHTLQPIAKDHFLSQRFENPDLLEQKARDKPVEVIHSLLHDLGPKTAAAIKEELSGWVIPEEEWSKWWQYARGKVKKDLRISYPDNSQGSFKLEKDHSYEERFLKQISGIADIDKLICSIYYFLRDLPLILKNDDSVVLVESNINEVLNRDDINDGQRFQLYLLLEGISKNEKKSSDSVAIVEHSSNLNDLVDSISILAFKKKVFVIARKVRSDWERIFLDSLFIVSQYQLREFLFQELDNSDAASDLEKKMDGLLENPHLCPDGLVWYFQKLARVGKIRSIDADKKRKLFEAFFMVLNLIENIEENRELVKKMHEILKSNRYEIVRFMMEGLSLEIVQELLLLASKCRSLGDHDLKIFYSLAEVVYPGIAQLDWVDHSEEPEIIWSTEEAYERVLRRVAQISEIEIPSNAKEIEIARSYGDLRENSEFKAALEKRGHLQSELNSLRNQMRQMRILSRNDISIDRVGVGSVVHLTNDKGKVLTYTILGPWDAEPSKGIISLQSRLAQEMVGLLVGDSFTSQGEKLIITAIESYIK